MKKLRFTPFLSVLLVWAAIPLPGETETEAEYKTERDQMVRTQISRRGVEDKAVLQAMRAVPRHRLVPDQLRDRA